MATCAVTIKAVHGWQTLADMYLLAAKHDTAKSGKATDDDNYNYSAFMSHAFLQDWNVCQQMAMKLHNRLDYCALSALNQTNSPLSLMLAKRWISKLLGDQKSDANKNVCYEHIVLQMKAYSKDLPEEALAFLQQTKQQLLPSSTKKSSNGSTTFQDEVDFNSNTQGRPVSLQQIQEWQVDLYLQLNKYHEALQILTEEMLVLLPNQWSYWKQVLLCVEKLHQRTNDDTDTAEQYLRDIVDTVIQKKTTTEKLLRGPKLILLEMLMLKAPSSQNNLKKFASTIQNYILSVSPIAICCFQDIRSYLTALVNTALEQKDEDTLSSMFHWALNEWKYLSNSSGNSTVSVWTLDKLQKYICLLKVLYQLIQQISLQQNEEEKKINDKKTKYLSEYTPTVEEMIIIYEQSLTSIQVTNNKQVLPGDDLILLAVQKLLNAYAGNDNDDPNHPKATVTYKDAAALLERAIHHSPFNASLKLTAIQIYFQLGAIERCWQLYSSMDIKQVQLDSCSYILLSQGILQQGAFFQEACQLASSILYFHKNVPYNVYEYSSRAMLKGHLSKACEILNFYHDKTKKSIMLRHAQQLLLECVPMTKFPNVLLPLQEAEEQCWKFLSQSHWEYAASSLLLSKDDIDLNHEEMNGNDDDFSDNRDRDIFHFEILPIISTPSILLPTVADLWTNASESATVQSIIVYSVLLVSGIKKLKVSNKKAMNNNPAQITQRAKCLFRQISIMMKNNSGNQWTRNISNLAYVILVAVTGFTEESQITDDSATVVLSLGEREDKVVSILSEIVFDHKGMYCGDDENYKKAVMKVYLSRYILPFCNLMNVTGTLFQQHMGWGKLKTTKPASIALRKIALSFRDCILHTYQICDNDYDDVSQGDDPSFLKENEIQIVLDHISNSKLTTKERMRTIFEQMKDSLDLFDVSPQTTNV